MTVRSVRDRGDMGMSALVRTRVRVWIRVMPRIRSGGMSLMSVRLLRVAVRVR